MHGQSHDKPAVSISPGWLILTHIQSCGCVQISPSEYDIRKGSVNRPSQFRNFPEKVVVVLNSPHFLLSRVNGSKFGVLLHAGGLHV